MIEITKGLLACFMSFLCLYGCSASENEVGGNWIQGLASEVEFPMEGGMEEYRFTLAGGLDASQLSCYVPEKDHAWCEADIQDNQLTLYVYRSYVETERYTNVEVECGTEHSFAIQVKQAAGIVESDIKIPVMTGTADSENSGNEMDKSYDGDYKTYFNSKGGMDVVSTFRMTYTLESGHTLYRIVYTPRTDSGNKHGSFNKFDVEVATEDNPAQFKEVASFERGDGVHTPLDFKLDQPVPNAKYVRFQVHSAYEKRVSCAEMEFYEPSENQVDYTALFADTLCTKLKDGVTEWQVKNLPDNGMRQLALALLEGNYDSRYRLAEYRPYQDPAMRAAENRTSRYSQSDNPTGIYAVAGEELYVAMEKPYEGAEVSILIRDLNGGYGNSKTYALHEGLNVIKPAVGGLVYVLNLVDEDIPLSLKTEQDKQRAAAKTVKIHFAMGKVNGYFDRLKNKPEEWTEILNNAAYQDIDMLGEYAHVTWRVDDLRQYQTDVIDLLDNFDKLVYLEEEFIGLEKYNRMFNNRMHFCIDYKATNPNASNYRTVYPKGQAKVICETSSFAKNLWGPAHEAGHMNQTRPGLKWLGTTEVTNNILSLYVQASFGETVRLWQVNSKGKTVYEYAWETIVKAGIPNCNGGVFERLVPFWQLKLYLVDALGQKDFYRDLYEYYRTYDYESLNASKYTHGVYQLDFVRQVCRLSHLNLLDFFEKWGFLTPIDRDVNDYSKGRFTITEAQIASLKAEIEAEGYDSPHPDVHLITDDNIANYKK